MRCFSIQGLKPLYSYLIAGIDVDAPLQIFHNFVQVACSGSAEEAGIAVGLQEKEKAFGESCRTPNAPDSGRQEC